MNLSKTISEKSHLFFIAFFIFMLAAFWITYFTRLFDQENYRMHMHGIILVLWCAMLVAQPLLIKNRKNSIHKLIGKFSYVLVPLLIYSTFDLLRYRITILPEVDYTFVALVVNALIVFIILYGLAIYFRKNQTIHSRLILSTAFPFFTPITDRIISIYFPSTLKYFPTINGTPNVPLFGFALADLILIILCIWDWRAHKRWNVFPPVFVLLLIYHISVNTFYQFSFWRNFSDWLMGI